MRAGGFAKRFQFHFLPPYSPEHYPIEKLWKQLHASVTRNHRCRTIEELMRNVAVFLKAASPSSGSRPSMATLGNLPVRSKAS